MKGLEGICGKYAMKDHDLIKEKKASQTER